MSRQLNIGEIEDALVSLLEQIDAIDDAAPPTRPPGPVIPSPYEGIDPSQLPTREQSAVDSIIEEPVRGACMLAIRLLGRRLHEMGASLEEMQDVAERVSERSKERGDRWYVRLDHRWDGIGLWVT